MWSRTSDRNCSMLNPSICAASGSENRAWKALNMLFTYILMCWIVRERVRFANQDECLVARRYRLRTKVVEVLVYRHSDVT